MESPIAGDRQTMDRQPVPHVSISSLLRAVGALGFLVVAGACGIGGPSGAGWRDANLQAVDGIWITGEDPCPPTSDDDLCRAARVTALGRVNADLPDSLPDDTISLARLPRKWFNARGEQILMTTGGMVHPQVAIVNLADGRRVAVGLLCQPTVTTEGAPSTPATCFDAPDVLAGYRVDGKGPNPYGDAP
jgi:hypothetical protein